MHGVGTQPRCRASHFRMHLKVVCPGQFGFGPCLYVPEQGYDPSGCDALYIVRRYVNVVQNIGDHVSDNTVAFQKMGIVITCKI
jgi:hypothetical protein